MNKQCPKCNSTHIIKNGKYAKDKSIQVYKCVECNYIWPDKPMKQYYKNTEHIQCHKCNSTNIGKEGHTTDGRQRYKCKNCGYRFTKDLKQATVYAQPRVISAKEKQLILMYHINLKQSVKSLAKSFDKPVKDVNNIIKTYKTSHPELFTKWGKLKKK